MRFGASANGRVSGVMSEITEIFRKSVKLELKCADDADFGVECGAILSFRKYFEGFWGYVCNHRNFEE